MICDKVSKLPYQISNKYFKNKSNEQKKRIIQGVTELIKRDELFEIKENYINSYSMSDSYNDSFDIYNNIKYSINSLNKTNYTSSYEENDNYYNDNNDKEIELELINKIYKEIIEIEYYPGNTNYQREYAFNQINELIFKD